MEEIRVSQQINDVAKDNLKKLKQLFPSVVKDGKVDFDALKSELGEIEETGSEKFELSWAGKTIAKEVSREDVIGKTLKYISKDGKNADTTENLYIEGDNLEVLKMLRQNYYEAVKMIYIDPPYNTGNDFVYNDSFGMSDVDADYADGFADEYGNRYSINNKSGNKFHANWLNMIYPRLRIARDLLSDDGVIFISIDDNERDNLCECCNEIFGENNYVATFPWRKRTAKSDVPFGVSQDYEWIVCYAKSDLFVAGVEGKERQYYETDDYPGRPWRIHDLTTQRTASERPNSNFVMKNPRNGDEYPANPLRTWAVTKETFKKYYDAGKIVFPGDYDFLKISKPAFRYWKSDDMEKAGEMFGIIAASTKLPDEVGMSLDGTKETGELIGGKVFSYPKTVNLIKHFVDISTKLNKDALIMDFFSGSATTAEAVMSLNAEDGGKRKYIMIQIPEEVPQNSEAYKAGFKNICEIGKERIRRAGDKVLKNSQGNKVDIGFKVFRVDYTNIKWKSLFMEGQLDLSQIESTPDMIDFMPNAKDIDIVYEIMLRQRDVPLSESIEKLIDIGERTYLYADAYLICLETEITTVMIDMLAAIDPVPVKYVFRDSAFKDDIALKDETFRRLKAVIEKNTNQTKQTYTVEFI